MQEAYLYNLLRFYMKNWILIISIIFLGLISGFVFSSYMQTPMYKSEATLLLVQPNALTSTTTQDVTLINNYIELFKSRRVLEPVIQKNNLNLSYDEIVGSVDASNGKNTEVIKVAVSATDPEKSKSFLEAAVASFKTQVAQLYKTDNVKVVDSASLASKPYNIHKELITFMSAMAGLVVMVIALFFIYDYKFIKENQSSANAVDEPEAKPIDSIIVQSQDVSRVEPQIAQITPEASQLLPQSTRLTRERLFQTSYSRERHTRR